MRIGGGAASAGAHSCGGKWRWQHALRAASRGRRVRGVAGGRAVGARAVVRGGVVRARGAAGTRRGGGGLRAVSRAPRHAAGAGRRRALRMEKPRDAAAGPARLPVARLACATSRLLLQLARARTRAVMSDEVSARLPVISVIMCISSTLSYS